jgi:hypothetical protein
MPGGGARLAPAPLLRHHLNSTLLNGELPLPYNRNTFAFLHRNKYAKEINMIFLFGLQINKIISL